MATDNYINLSVGWDTVNAATIKTLPIGNTFKYMLALKTQTLAQSRYEFKFMGFEEKDLELFTKIIEIQKTVALSRNYRCVNLAVKCDPDYEQLPQEEVKSEFDHVLFADDDARAFARVVLTDVRAVILKEKEKKMNISIPWLMFKSIEKEEEDGLMRIRMHCRGVLSPKILALSSNKAGELKKLYLELKSFSETYNKSPVLGYQFSAKSGKEQDEISKNAAKPEIEELEDTKVRLRRKNNAYQSNQGFGLLEHTEFNEELGLMI